MAVLNFITRSLTAKVVYYGPGLCGKTTNLKYIHENTEDEQHTKMLTLSTEADRTLFFDFLPMDLGTMRGMKIRVQLYTVPGQVYYEETRRRVLKGCDGVVFVADSQRRMAEANIESMLQLHQHLQRNGLKLEDVPMVLQYNKRDLGDLLSIEELDRDLNPNNAPFFEAVASEGIGVEDTLKAAIRLVIKSLVAKGVVNQSGADENVAAPRPGRGDEAIPMDLSEPLLLQGAEPELGLDSGADLFIESEGVTGPPSGLPLSVGPGALPAASTREIDSGWPLSESEKDGEILLGQDATGGLDAVVLREDTGSENHLLETIQEMEPAGEAVRRGATHEKQSPAKSGQIPLPHIRLKPGEPLEADIEIAGKTYRLKIELDPVSPDD